MKHFFLVCFSNFWLHICERWFTLQWKWDLWGAEGWELRAFPHWGKHSTGRKWLDLLHLRGSPGGEFLWKGCSLADSSFPPAFEGAAANQQNPAIPSGFDPLKHHHPHPFCVPSDFSLIPAEKIWVTSPTIPSLCPFPSCAQFVMTISFLQPIFTTQPWSQQLSW